MTNHFRTRTLRRSRTVLSCLALVLGLMPLSAVAKTEMLDRIAAVVNDDVIMESQLDVRVEEVLASIRTEDADPRLPPMNVMRKQVLERMILEELQVQQAERAGIRVDDTSLNEALAGIGRQNGMSLEQFSEAIRADGMEWQRFREDIRRDMIINQLRQRRVSQRVRVTDREVDRFLSSELGKQLFEEEYRLGHILIAVPDAAAPDQVQAAQEEAEQLLKQLRQGASFRELAISQSDGQFALEGGDLGWRPAAQLPSLFSSAVADKQPGEFVGPLRSGAGFHLLVVKERRGGAQKFVEQYRARHILVESNAIRPPEAALALARDLRQQVMGGADMSALAREYSDDPGSARNGGDLDWVTPGEMVPAFDNMMTSTPPGELSPVFETEYGWHFLRVEETRTEDMSEEFRRLKARQTLHQRRFGEELELWLQELRQESYVDIRI